ncbi:MAG: CDP-alcohol phosphatidyltransferase family protein [candidate division Zixibacteria bacterium]|nr:CDP-alcohol phosphatidyltransferase family protein [candidate division Zixibacteria bacterium]
MIPKINHLKSLPNLISLSRVGIAPLIGYFLSNGDGRGTAISLGLCLLAGFTDWLDGYLARKTKQVSGLGIALDPLADKLFAAILVVCLILYRNFPLWLATVIIARDVLILIAASLLLRERKIDLPSNLTGKYTFFAIVILLVSYIVEYSFGIRLTTIVTCLLVAFSLINYGVIFVALRGNKRPPVYDDSRAKRTVRVTLTCILLVIYVSGFFREYF